MTKSLAHCSVFFLGVVFASLGLSIAPACWGADPEPVVISTQPQSQTIEEGKRVTLSVGIAGGSPPITYQWFINGFPIENGTNQALSFRSVQQSDSGDYFVQIVNPAGVVDSDPATLTVTPDVTPPAILDASSLDGSRIKIVWNEVLNAFTAGYPGSYHIWGATVIDAQLVTDNLGDSNTVVLTVSGLTTSIFDIGVAAGFGILDQFGNEQTGDPLASGKVFAPGSGLTEDSVVGTAADPLEKGSTTVDINHLDVVAGGSDIGSNRDAFRFVYGQYTGDFDLKVRIPRLDPRNRLSKAGFVIREDLTPDARALSAVITPHETALDGSGEGANELQAVIRSSKGGVATDWGSRPTNSFPWTNVWIRVQRIANTFKAFRGTDGVSWSLFATNTIALPDTLYVGLAASAHNNAPGQTTRASFENYARILPPMVKTHPQTQNVNEGDLVTFTVVATGEAPLTYQWRKQSVDIPGATADTYTIGSVGPDSDGDYDVIVSNVDSSIASLMATLSVRLKPRISAHPQSQAVSCGSVTFTVSAAGGPPLSYQWSKDGTAISGATANTYTINPVSAAAAGSYTVKVSNDIGEATSDPGVLTIIADSAPIISCPAPIITQCSGPSGTVVNYSVTAADDCDPAPVINCFPVSGSHFPVGTTTVQCTARDSAGHTSSCSFAVTVEDNPSARLTITLSPAIVTLTWPQSCATYTLEARNSLDASVPWGAAGGTLSTSGGINRVTLPRTSGNRFFRLHSQ
jgi:hypothetical protein